MPNKTCGCNFFCYKSRNKRRKKTNQDHANPPLQTTDYKFDKYGYWEPPTGPVTIGDQLVSFTTARCGCIIYKPNLDLKFRLPDNLSTLEDYKWVQAQDGNVPENAIVVGMESSKRPIYASRVKYNNYNDEVVPAKLIAGKDKAYLGCTASGATEYEVLCGPGVTWKRTSRGWGGGAIPSEAFPVGRSGTGQIYFMGRAPFLNTLTPGKVSRGLLYIARNGKEIIIEDFEVMCYDTPKEIKKDAVKKIENFWLSKMYSPNSRYVRNVILPRFESALEDFS